MRFWDASAIVPLLVEEEASKACRGWLASDEEIIVWFLTATEATSAVRRKARMGELADIEADAALQRLRAAARSWTEVEARNEVRARAHRLLAVHDLRAADALQLAAALVVTSERPSMLPMVCLDRRLCLAARREGFDVLTC